MMGLRLVLLNWWTPKYVIGKELKSISDKTMTALTALISKYAPEIVIASQNRQPSKNIQEQRAAMAEAQANLVDTLARAVGHEEAIRAGREALFSVGQNLGKEAGRRLGVGDSPDDLTMAAKILYRVLGIEFHIQWHGQSSATIIVDRCSLAEKYSELTCQVLSATDEGVVTGLQPKVTMKFKEYITSGCKNCFAEIGLSEKEASD